MPSFDSKKCESTWRAILNHCFIVELCLTNSFINFTEHFLLICRIFNLSERILRNLGFDVLISSFIKFDSIWEISYLRKISIKNIFGYIFKH